MNNLKTVDICSQLRSSVAGLVSSIPVDGSEKIFCQNLLNELAKNPLIYPEGWYAPPPSGLAALFGAPDDNYERLKFDTLRKEQFWPCLDRKLSENGGVGIIYLSPVDIKSGTIADFGITVCRGGDKRITSHLANCLNVLEAATEYAQVGMPFCDLHDFAQKLFIQSGLTNARTVTWTDKVGTNLGHTIPWSYELPNQVEQQIIAGGNFKKLSQLISEKRVNVNKSERFKIPENIAFTLEARLESAEDITLPNVFYHLIITYREGAKKVLADFNKVFDSFDMCDVRSRYS